MGAWREQANIGEVDVQGNEEAPLGANMRPQHLIGGTREVLVVNVGNIMARGSRMRRCARARFSSILTLTFQRAGEAA